ncbi:MAG: HAD family phosphatase [Rhodoferax sp.]|nr:MAG: HAD family phosphatase [Rhodoferax sp.]
MNYVFDFGAVLVTWKPVNLLAECFPQQADSPAHAGHLAHEVFGHADWQSYDRGTLTMAEVIDRTSARLGLDAQRFAALVGSIGQRLIPMEYSIAWLAGLKAQRDAGQDVRLYFLSNMPVDYARVLEQEHAFVRWFDGGIFSGDVGSIKPEAAIYQQLQERHGLVPQQTVFFDDLLGNVQAARALGWHAVQFHNAAQAQRDWAGIQAEIS